MGPVYKLKVTNWSTVSKIVILKLTPGTPKPTIFMDGNGETNILHVKIWNRPIERTILKRIANRFPG